MTKNISTWYTLGSWKQEINGLQIFLTTYAKITTSYNS